MTRGVAVYQTVFGSMVYIYIYCYIYMSCVYIYIYLCVCDVCNT